MTKHIKTYTLIFFSTLIANNLFGQNTPNPKFELYILIGQSNMAGRGPITDELKDEGNDSVFSFNKEKQWVIARHPLHFDKPGISAVGPGLSFGIVMAKANPKVRIGLIPCAVGGTPIEHWEPGAFDPPTKTHPYDDAVERIKAAMQYGVIKGVIWHQGESNADPEKSKEYLDKLIELIGRVRTLVNNPQLPFIAGEIGQFYKNQELINDQLKLLPAKVPFTAVASSNGLKNKGDNTHFDGASADELGKRYAAKMLEVQKQKVKK
jgi:hypothetical protein